MPGGRSQAKTASSTPHHESIALIARDPDAHSMNAVAQPLGLVLIAMALGAAALFATRSRFDPRWGRFAIVVVAAILTALVGLVAYSVVVSPMD